MSQNRNPDLSESKHRALLIPLCWELEGPCFCGLGRAGTNLWMAGGSWVCGIRDRFLKTAGPRDREQARESDRRCLLHPLGTWVRALARSIQQLSELPPALEALHLGTLRAFASGSIHPLPFHYIWAPEALKNFSDPPSAHDPQSYMGSGSPPLPTLPNLAPTPQTPL